MLSIFHSESPAREAPPDDTDSVDYEIVVGRLQIASAGLVLMVLLAVFSAVSYLVGKATAPEPVLTMPTPPAFVPAPAPDAALVPQSPLTPIPLPPLFADPVRGSVYIQVGAVEKGVAAIWAEGLRTHGLAAFVAPGPSEKIFRTLVGPLPSPESYQRAKEVLNEIGLSTFGKRYEPEQVSGKGLQKEAP